MDVPEKDILVIVGAGASSDYRMPTNSQLKDFLIEPSRYLNDDHVRNMPHANFGRPFEVLDILSKKLFSKINEKYNCHKIDQELSNILKESGHKTIDHIWCELNDEKIIEHAKLLKTKALSIIILFMLARKTFTKRSWLSDLSNKIGLHAILKMNWVIFNYDLFFEEDLVDIYHRDKVSFYLDKEKSEQIRGLTRLTNPLALEISGASPIVETLRPMGWIDPMIFKYEDNFHILIHDVNNEHQKEANMFLDEVLGNVESCVYMEEALTISTLPNKRDRESIRGIVKSCKKIIFLGYGFNTKNNELLSNAFENDVLPKTFGTCLGDEQKIAYYNDLGAKLKNLSVLSFIDDWENNTNQL